MKNTRSMYLRSVLAMVICIVMLIGSTFAWFTDSVSSGKNIITVGNLDLEMYWTDNLDSGVWYNVEENGHNTIFSYDNWEPGYTDVKYVKLVNAGSLALNYQLTLTPENGVGKLAEVINVYFAEGGVAVKQRADLTNLRAIGLLDNVLNGGATADGTLLAKDQYSPLHPSGEVIMTVAMNMLTTAGNEYMNEDAGTFSITALATQAPFESDSFGNDYDTNAEYPAIINGTSVKVPVTPVNGKIPAGGVTLSKDGVSAFVPEGALVKDGATELEFKVTPLKNTTSDITVVNNEILIPVDVHIEGLADNNTVPAIIDLGEVLPKYLNMGNYRLFHVEDGVNNEMTLVADASALTAHNSFTYDPLTGKVVVAMASFSEVALLADTTNGWEGKEDYTWYNTTDTNLYIANADQLHAFAKIVGGMAKNVTVNNETKTFETDSFSGKTVTLLSDINLNHGTVLPDEKNTTKTIFYPIGYNNNKDFTSGNEVNRPAGTQTDVTSGVEVFNGTFDGNGHTIANFYQNTWEMFGDYNSGYSENSNYYKDAMGLFAWVDGTVKNLTVDNFKSDGEFTPTGVIAAYAGYNGGATFENIAITNCNPRVYNTGNGGIVGIGGNKEQENEISFKNITIDNSNKITALWGSWDVACGGLMGMFRGKDSQTAVVTMNNCHVAAQIDVYNDVCGNYQYYWYRYSGMMVGTNYNMTTENGYTVPNTKQYKAENCTVHFGDWNDYYYCELVANSLASYTHDHQFSRLEVIESKAKIQDENGNWNRTGNFLVFGEKGKQKVSGEGTCYHIMKDAEGNLYEHKHDVADATNKEINEVVNGETVLKENNQRIYLPFNQLFTGYGWGVKHIPVYNGENYAFKGIEILDRKVADSVVKFEKADTAKESYMNGNTVTVGDLFKTAKIDDEKLTIQGNKVQVTVSPASDGSTAGGTYTANTTDWTQGTLTFSGTGAATITIQDYYFCIPTTINVTITEKVVTKKFDTKFKGDFLYRVGNKNAVALGSLFAKKGDATIGTVEVEIENVAGNASGAYTSNTTWTNGTIQFSGTGVVKVTITDNDFCTPTELYLEVVDATNVAEGGKIGNYNTTSVLLGDTSVSTLYLNGGATLYGNGFTIDCTNSPINGSGSVSENYIIELVDAHLDNVKIVGKVYTEYGAMASNNYNRALVVSKGNSTITNCYLSNTASPIRLIEGSLKVKGTTVKGGNFANIDVRNGHLTVEDVTTINQALGNDKAEDGSTVIGLGIVVYYENVDTSLTSVTINGNLTQYNHISSNDKFSHEYATQLVSKMMDSNYSAYQCKNGDVTWVNPGYVGMTNVKPSANLSGYNGNEVKFMSYTGYVYANQPTSETIVASPSEYKTIGQGLIAPAYSFDFTTKNYIAKTDSSNDYCYYENGKVLIAMDQGDTFNWDPFILTATKFGKTLNYTVTMNGKTYASGEKIAFNASGDYVVTYTYTDNNNYVILNGNLATIEETYTKTVNISVSVIKPTTKNATFTFADTNTATEKVTVNDKTYISAKDVSATDKEWGYITVNGTKIFYPITEAQMKTSSNLLGAKETQVYYYVFKDAVTITDYKDGGTGGEQKYDSSKQDMPSNLTVVNGMEAKYTAISSACVDISKLNKDGPSGEVWDFSASTTVSGTTTYNGYLAHSSPSGLSVKSGTRDYDAITVAQFSYTDAAGATYYYFVGYFMPNQNTSDSGGTSPCVTSDTLVTLADGTQKRIDEVSYNDNLLVWNFYEGKYDVAPIAIIFDHGADNNTVIKLNFNDGTTVKVVNMHQFFDANLNKLVTINEETVKDYVGHKFAKHNGNSTKFVELESYSVTHEYVEAWGIMTAGHYNIITADMISADFDLKDVPLFNYFEVGDDMKFDEDKMQADIEKYGLYTYEEFADYLTYEQFVAFNVQYFKIPVGKGLYTYEGIIELIEQYLK